MPKQSKTKSSSSKSQSSPEWPLDAAAEIMSSLMTAVDAKLGAGSSEKVFTEPMLVQMTATIMKHAPLESITADRQAPAFDVDSLAIKVIEPSSNFDLPALRKYVLAQESAGKNYTIEQLAKHFGVAEINVEWFVNNQHARLIVDKDTGKVRSCRLRAIEWKGTARPGRKKKNPPPQ